MKIFTVFVSIFLFSVSNSGSSACVLLYQVTFAAGRAPITYIDVKY